MTTPTATPIPSSDPSDLLFNAEKIDEAVNSGALTYLDRFSVTRKTLAGATAALALVNPRGAWTTATAYAPRDVVSNSGTWYIALDAHTSGATFAGDSAAHWRVHQGVLAVDLADATDSAKGAGQVGYDVDLAYAFGTAGFQLRQHRHIFDFMSSAQVADVTSGTNALDLVTVFQAARDWAAGLGRPAEIEFPAYKYKFSASPNWNVNNLKLTPLGLPEFICTGTGPVLKVDGTAAWVYNQEFGSFILTGNAACVTIWQMIKPGHGRYASMRMREGLTYGLDLVLGVCNRIDMPICSVNQDPGMVTKPARGMRLTSLGGLAATANTIINPIMEGTAQGIELGEADFNTFIGGTAEACTVRGLAVGPLAKGNTFRNLTCEANTTEDVLDQGVGTVIEGGYFQNKISYSGAQRPILRRVRCQDIVADATTTAPTIEYCDYSAFGAGGAITINSAVTKRTLRKNFNVNLGTYANFGVREFTNPTTTVASITVGASPFTYTNTSDFDEDIVVRAGTVSSIEFIRGAVTTLIGGSANLPSGGIFRANPGDQIKVTFSGALEMVRIPR